MAHKTQAILIYVKSAHKICRYYVETQEFQERTVRQASEYTGFSTPVKPDSIVTGTVTVSQPVSDVLYCVFKGHEKSRFKRKGDWKDHMDSYHKPGPFSWWCNVEGCDANSFETIPLFRQHHATDHHCRRACTHAESARREAPPKHAFACGFSPCVTGIFDSWNEWRDHVRDHILGGAEPDFWHYSVEFRNLLRQEKINDTWDTYVKSQLGFIPTAAYSFHWERETSEQAKRYLEYGNLDYGSKREIEKIFLAATRVETLVIDNRVTSISTREIFTAPSTGNYLDLT
jgi:hypothetical protein